MAKKSKQTFNEAYRAARKQGKKTFPWNEKSYSTELGDSRGKLNPRADWPEVFDEGKEPGDMEPAGYKRGGSVKSKAKVRGCGCASSGTRKAKMY